MKKNIYNEFSRPKRDKPSIDKTIMIGLDQILHPIETKFLKL